MGWYAYSLVKVGGRLSAGNGRISRRDMSGLWLQVMTVGEGGTPLPMPRVFIG